MRLLSRGLLCAVLAVLVLDLAGAGVSEAQESQAVQSQNSSGQRWDASPAPKVEYAAASEFPDSPGSVLAQQQATRQNGSAAQQTNSAPSAPSNTGAGQQAPAESNQKLQRPVGTAAAEAPRVSGITAAEPAGIAIAPAKQHRVRTIAIKVGAILGASAALGTVIALTAATPSKPPGAH